MMVKNRITHKSSRVKRVSKLHRKSSRSRRSSVIRNNRKSINNSASSFRDPKLRNHDKMIVRVMGKGQFRINRRTATKINALDNSMVDIVKRIIKDEKEFKKKLKEIHSLVSKDGQELEDSEIVKSDIILPNNDLSIHDAKDLFKGEGIIPD
jgi:PspA-Associated protein